MKLPDLKIGNRNRMLTKHFTNFCLVLDRDSLGDIKVSKITWSSYARVEDYPLSDEEKSFYDMPF